MEEEAGDVDAAEGAGAADAVVHHQVDEPAGTAAAATHHQVAAMVIGDGAMEVIGKEGKFWAHFVLNWAGKFWPHFVFN